MGLAALRKILPPTPTTLEAFSGKTLAVDADNLLWTFVTAIREPPIFEGRNVSHLIGLSNRLKLYAERGIRSAWVFDGEQPRLKEATLAAREEARPEGAPSLTAEQLVEAKELMTALGVPWLVAPGESDAQCAHFARSGQAFAAATQDYDAALHASPRTARNLSLSKTRTPEILDLELCLLNAKLTREQLVDVAILIGTDYNDGIPGVGPAKAVKLVQREGGLHEALRALGAKMPEADEVRALFLAHLVDERARLQFRAPDAARVERALARGGLSQERADALARAMTRLHS